MYRVGHMDTSGRFDILIHVQPWQSLLFEPEPLVDLAVGELGATGITISIKAAEPQAAVALDPAGQLLGARLASGVLYQPNPQGYASTRLRPVPCPALKTRQPIARLAEVCRGRSHRLRLRISVLHDAAMAGRYGDAGICNALSLPADGRLCPSNPDVLEFVRCQLLDIREQFEPDLIEIEEFTWPDLYPATAAVDACRVADPGPVESALLALCFCPSCRQQAILVGVDAAAALRSVQVHLKRWLTSARPYPGTLSDLLAKDEVVTGYIVCQHQSLLQAVQVWTQAVPETSLLVVPDCPRGDSWDAGTDPGRAGDAPTAGYGGSPWNPSFEELARMVPRLTLRVKPRGYDPHHDCGRQVGARGHACLEAAVDATDPSFVAGPDIVRCLTDLARADVEAIELENGLGVSPSRRPFIRQAIRAARRERHL